MTAVYKRDLKSYFTSMTAYVFISALVLFIGIFFMAFNLVQGQPYFAYSLGNDLFILMIAIPILTMKSMSEDRHAKTDQLLFTSPSSVTGIILGKYFAMLTVVLIPIAVSALCPIVIAIFGESFNLISDYAAILEFYLICAAFVSIGMFISSLTESQLIAAVGTLGVFLVLYFMEGITGFISASSYASYVGFIILLAIVCGLYYSMSKNRIATLSAFISGLAILTVLFFVKNTLFENALPNLLKNLSPIPAFENSAYYSLFDLSAVVKCVSISAFFVFLTIQVTLKRRWS